MEGVSGDKRRAIGKGIGKDEGGIEIDRGRETDTGRGNREGRARECVERSGQGMRWKREAGSIKSVTVMAKGGGGKEKEDDGEATGVNREERNYVMKKESRKERKKTKRRATRPNVRNVEKLIQACKRDKATEFGDV